MIDGTNTSTAKSLRMRHILAVGLGLLLMGTAAEAQVRGGASVARMSSAHARSASRMQSFSGGTIGSSTGIPGARQATFIRILPNGRVASGFATATSLAGFGSANGVPGLGFDYSHLAAVSGPLQNNRSLRIGHGAHHTQSSFVPILFGGYPYYFDSLDNFQGYDQSQQPAQPQPQVIVIQQPVPASPGQQNVDPGNDSVAQPSFAAPVAPPVPIRDVGEFVLVRHDGRILFASAFSVVGPQLQYVSPDGIRHTLPVADLDADATQQMNEARGTTVQISN
jgi:hypothetical protein